MKEGGKSKSGKSKGKSKSGQPTSKIHLRIQQRTTRKSITTIEGLPAYIDYKYSQKFLKKIKKQLCCNGSIAVLNAGVGAESLNQKEKKKARIERKKKGQSRHTIAAAAAAEAADKEGDIVVAATTNESAANADTDATNRVPEEPNSDGPIQYAIQLQGDHRQTFTDFLVDEIGVKKENVITHGF